MYVNVYMHVVNVYMHVDKVYMHVVNMYMYMCVDKVYMCVEACAVNVLLSQNTCCAKTSYNYACTIGLEQC